MLNKIKISLRISHDKLDRDIKRNIDACLIDLQRVGVNTKRKDPLIVKSVELYCKWQYDYENKGERWETAYNNLVNVLRISGDYYEE